MNRRQYQYIFDDFVENCPGLATTVKSWEPKGPKTIRVYLNNGDSVIYNYVLQGIRSVRSNNGTEDDWKRDFRDVLVEKMADYDYTQAELAQAIGVSQPAISSYLNKRSVPNGYVLSKLAKLFDCSLDELMRFGG